jgi:hypothetical protein
MLPRREGSSESLLPPQTVNEVPQPQVPFAFGFWKTKPLLSRLVS